MGLRGPPATPTAILKARGSRMAAEREGEVQFPDGIPTCPDFLSDEAKAEWERQVGQLDDAGILCEVDRATLACWCEAWSEFCQLCKAIDVQAAVKSPVGHTPAGYAGAIAMGLVNAKNKAVERLLRLAAQFGFTPAARARIKGPEVLDEQDDIRSRYFAG